MVELEPVGNQLSLVNVGNSISLQLFDVYTDHYYLNQFLMLEEHEEVVHANSD